MSKKYLSPKLIKLVLIMAVCGLLIFLNPKEIFSPARGFFLVLARPFEKILYVLSRKTGDTLDFLGSISELRRENEKLVKENSALNFEVSDLRGEKKENETLREQLGLIPKKKFDLEAGYVIGQDPQKLGSWLLIDKGYSSGVEVGMPVIVSDGIIIGKIEESFINSSKASLLTSSSSSINASDSETGAKGIVRGEFGLGVIMDLVPQTDVLNTGDEVSTSGLGSDIPKNLLIGKIQEVKTTQDKLFQQALIIPPVKYSNLDVVFVIKKTK